MPTKELNENTPISEIMEFMSKMLDEKVRKFSSQDDVKKVKTKMDTKLEKFASVIFDIIKENRTLKEKVRVLEENQNRQEKTLGNLEDQIKRKNIIIRGVAKNRNLYAAIDEVIEDKLRMDTPLQYEIIGKLAEKRGKMDILVELQSEKMVHKVFSYASNLQGTSIIIERDLTAEKLQDKHVLLELRKDILLADSSQSVIVRSDRIKIGTDWLKWNYNKELMCGRKTAKEILENVYGDDISSYIELNYTKILTKIDVNKRSKF